MVLSVVPPIGVNSATNMPETWNVVVEEVEWEDQTITCNCAKDNLSVLCKYGTCPTCNEDGTIWGTTSFGYTFDAKDGYAEIWTSSFE